MKKNPFFIDFFHCIYTNTFCVDVENIITRKPYYVDDYGIEKDKAYIIQLLVVMGKFHIHKMK